MPEVAMRLPDALANLLRYIRQVFLLAWLDLTYLIEAIWNCFASLVQPFLGHTRHFVAVFAGCEAILAVLEYITPITLFIFRCCYFPLARVLSQ